MDPASIRTILTTGRGYWSATPWNYSSMRSLRFQVDGSGELVYGYGQTIYAVIQCCWEVSGPGKLELTYQPSPALHRFPGFTPTDVNSGKAFDFQLQLGEFGGTQSIVPANFTFLWKLDLSEPPWPDCLQLPYEIPREFYGHRVTEKKTT
jgi:hypothetical protein